MTAATAATTSATTTTKTSIVAQRRLVARANTVIVKTVAVIAVLISGDLVTKHAIGRTCPTSVYIVIKV